MDRARVAVLVSGRGSNMAALIYASRAADCPFEVVLVTGDKPDAPALTIAAAERVPVAPLDSKALGADFWAKLEETLRDASVDLIALAGFMRIIPREFVDAWAGLMVNIHPSLLPKYPGLHSHRAALENGDGVTGATVHLVTAEVDRGEILGQVKVAILPDDSAQSLEARVLIAEHQLYPRVLADYVAGLSRSRSDRALGGQVSGG